MDCPITIKTERFNIIYSVSIFTITSLSREACNELAP